MSSGVQAGADQLVEGWDEQGAEASAGAGVGEVDGARRQGWRVSISSSSPAGIAGSFFSVATLLIVCTRIALAATTDMRVVKFAGRGKRVICRRCSGAGTSITPLDTDSPAPAALSCRNGDVL